MRSEKHKVEQTIEVYLWRVLYFKNECRMRVVSLKTRAVLGSIEWKFTLPVVLSW